MGLFFNISPLFKSLFPFDPLCYSLSLVLFLNSYTHRLIIELELQSLFGLLCAAVLVGWDPATLPLLLHFGSYTTALLVSQDTLQIKIPKFRDKYSQKRNIGVAVPISTFMRLYAIYIFPRSVSLFCWRKYVHRPILGLYKSLTDMHINVEIGAKAALFPEKEYIKGIFVAV